MTGPPDSSLPLVIHSFYPLQTTNENLPLEAVSRSLVSDHPPPFVGKLRCSRFSEIYQAGR
jgi:hypothetical protein